MLIPCDTERIGMFVVNFDGLIEHQGHFKKIIEVNEKVQLNIKTRNLATFPVLC